MKVAWFSLESLGAMMRRCRADDSIAKVVGRMLRADLIVVDDIGLLPVSPDTAEGLYRLVDAAYERRSVAISSNLHPSGFDELMPKTLATATVDRLLHHAHICVTSDSIRLAQATTGQTERDISGPATPHPTNTGAGAMRYTAASTDGSRWPRSPDSHPSTGSESLPPSAKRWMSPTRGGGARLGSSPARRTPTIRTHVSQRARCRLLDHGEGLDRRLGFGGSQRSSRLGLDGDARHVVRNRVVQLPGHLLALAQLHLMHLPGRYCAAISDSGHQ